MANSAITGFQAALRGRVLLRCTGWEYRPGKASSVVWAENEPYENLWSASVSTCVEIILHAIDAPDTLVDFHTGEHSSFPELEAFVRALCPREVVPTVNASTRDRRDKLRDLFSPGTDLKRDKGRMDAYLKGGALEAVDVQRQKRLLASFSKASEVEVDPALVEQLRAIIGEAPHDYCARLLRARPQD